MALTLEEVNGDLAATERDILALKKIIDGYETFIFQSHGEDRRDLRVDLMRAQSLLARAEALLPKILAKKSELEAMG